MEENQVVPGGNDLDVASSLSGLFLCVVNSCWSNVSLLVTKSVIGIGHDNSKPVGKTRNFILDVWCGSGTTLARFIFGWWVTFHELDVDYSKYLGPDWK